MDWVLWFLIVIICSCSYYLMMIRDQLKEMTGIEHQLEEITRLLEQLNDKADERNERL
jgi:preprotein translocase subunit YajC